MAITVVLLVVVGALWVVAALLLRDHWVRQNRIIGEWERRAEVETPTELTAREIAILSPHRSLTEVVTAELVIDRRLRLIGRRPPYQVDTAGETPDLPPGDPARQIWVAVRTEGPGNLWRVFTEEVSDPVAEARLRERGLLLPESVRERVAESRVTRALRGWVGWLVPLATFLLVAGLAFAVDWPLWARLAVVLLALVLYRLVAASWGAITAEPWRSEAGLRGLNAERRRFAWPRPGIDTAEYRVRLLKAVALHGLPRVSRRVGVGDIETAQRETGLDILELIALGERSSTFSLVTR